MLSINLSNIQLEKINRKKKDLREWGRIQPVFEVSGELCTFKTLLL